MNQILKLGFLMATTFALPCVWNQVRYMPETCPASPFWYSSTDYLAGTDSLGDQTKTDKVLPWIIPYSDASYDQILFTTNNF